MYHKYESCVKVQREWRHKFQCHNTHVPSRQAIIATVKKFGKFGEITDQRKRNARPNSARTDDIVKRVRRSVSSSPLTSLRKRSSQLEISQTTLFRILHSDLKMYPYRISTHQLLTDVHKANRVSMAKQFHMKMEASARWIKKVWFSDEAHFHLNGVVNTQNYRFWGQTNPRLDPVEKPLHSPKVTAWCALSARGIIGPFFF